MWYAVQVRTGEEEKSKILCERLIAGEVLKECFIPHYEKKLKYLGKWQKREEILFPGYLFLISDSIKDLRMSISKIPGLIKILGSGNEVIPLYDREVDFLLNFGKAEHLIKMSQGFMENDRIIIMEGPMMDYEGSIKRVDRHKRIAVLEVEFFGRIMEVKVGLEIVKKVVSEVSV